MGKELIFALEIERLGESVYAREVTPGTGLPKACSNRHIMALGHFCLGLDYGSQITNEDNARHWWRALFEYLKLQGIAQATGCWPRHMELDHGDAGKYHRAALNAARELGIAEEYELALLGQNSWITNGTVRLNKEGTRLINGRAPCPVQCKKGKRLRRNCCSQKAVVRLLFSERQRSRHLKEFWDSQYNSNDPCCGTMVDCPLRKRNEGKASN